MFKRQKNEYRLFALKYNLTQCVQDAELLQLDNFSFITSSNDKGSWLLNGGRKNELHTIKNREDEDR
jgi:hypothetical protein